MSTLPMRSKIDCGRVSASNHVSTMTGKLAESLYDQTDKFAQPKRWPMCDFWDSPSRQIAMIEALSGQRAGLVPVDPLLVPSAVLIRLGFTAFHWITVLGVQHGAFHWHDGEQEQHGTFEQRFPGSRVVLAVAIGGVIPLPWYWRLWGAITWPIRRLW